MQSVIDGTIEADAAQAAETSEASAASEPAPATETREPETPVGEKPRADTSPLGVAYAADREGRNRDAIAEYEKLVEASKDGDDDESKETHFQALCGLARVHLQLTAYDKVQAYAETMTQVAATKAHEAEAERWTALSLERRGDKESAARHRRKAIEAAREVGSEGRQVLAEALCDEALALREAGEMDEAKERLREARRVARAKKKRTRIGVLADLIEGGIERREGRLSQAAALFTSAHTTAEILGYALETARSANALGNVHHELGAYDRAQRSFEDALEIGEELGSTEFIIGPSIGLASVATKTGDFEAARAYNEQALAEWEKAGDVAGMALATANLSQLSAETGAYDKAIEEANASLTLLEGGANENLRALVTVDLGNAQLASGDLDAARTTYESIPETFTGKPHMRAHGLATAGLGRICLEQKDAEAAKRLLVKAVDVLGDARAGADAAEARLDLARALYAAGDTEGATRALDRAREQLDRARSFKTDKAIAEVQALLGVEPAMVEEKAPDSEAPATETPATETESRPEAATEAAPDAVETQSAETETPAPAAESEEPAAAEEPTDDDVPGASETPVEGDAGPEAEPKTLVEVPPDATVDDGVKALYGGKHDEALAIFQQVIANTTGDDDQALEARATAYKGVAHVHYENANYEALKAWADTMLAESTCDVEKAEATRWLGVIADKQGDHAAAAAHFANAIKMARDAGAEGRAVLAEALCDEGQLHGDRGENKAARNRFREARRIVRAGGEPTRIGVLANIYEGGICRRQGELSKAIALFSEAKAGADELGIVDEQIRAAKGLGSSRLLAGDLERAKRAYESAIEVGEKAGSRRVVGIKVNLGLVLQSMGDLAMARVNFEQAAATWEKAGDRYSTAVAKCNLAELAIEEGDGADAVAYAQAALKLLEGGIHKSAAGHITAVLGDAQLVAGDPAAAKATYEGLLESFPEEKHPDAVGFAWRGLGRIALQASDFRSACDWLRKAVEKLADAKAEEGSAATRLELAQALAAANDPVGAKQELARARGQFELMKRERQLERVAELEAQLASPGVPPASG